MTSNVARPRALHLAWIAAGVASLGCGGGDTAPRPPHAVPFRVIAGGGITDTVQAHLTTALIVEIHDSTGGSGAGRVVRFESLPPDDTARKTETAILVGGLAGINYGTFLAPTADSLGQAKVLVGLGTVAGTARLRVSVPEFGLVDTVLYTVLPGATTKLNIAVRDTTVQPGDSYALHVLASDRLNNPNPGDALTFTAFPGVASVTPSGQVTVGNSMARSKIAITWKTGSDTARVSVITRLPLVGVARLSVNRQVILANTDGTGYTGLAISTDESLSPSSVKATSDIVYYTGSPGGNATVWIVSPNRPARILTTAGLNIFTAQWPRLSPDGQWVYFVGQHPGQSQSVWRIRTDGTGLDSLGTSTMFSLFAAPGVSPDGRFVTVLDASGLRVIDVATKAVQIVHTSISCTQPRYSADGTRIACVSNGALTVINADGSGPRQLASGVDDIYGVDWTPDGAWIIAHVGGTGYQLVSVSDGTMLSLPFFASSYLQLSFVR
jgi:Tol biopolymer transport system component